MMYFRMYDVAILEILTAEHLAWVQKELMVAQLDEIRALPERRHA